MRVAFTEWRSKRKQKKQTQDEGDLSSTKLYVYKELKQPTHIRVLQLQLGSQDDEQLVGRLVPRSLDDNPLYIAISYVWGEAEFFHRIRTPQNRTLYITASLWRALRDIRNWERRALQHAEDWIVTLWADGS